MVTHKLSVVTTYVKDLLETNKVALDIHTVFYGDQITIPASRTVCVEPGEKTREFNETGLRTQNDMTVLLMAYVFGLGSNQDVQKEADEFCEAIEDLLNKDASHPNINPAGTRLGGLVTSGLVSSVEHGYSTKNNVLMRANRMLFSCMSQTPLV